MSETASCRQTLLPYCLGNGLDIGAGGDPIQPSAICVDRDEFDGRRSHVGAHPTHLIGDAADLWWFTDASLDYVYSSHCLEDAEDTAAWLREWLRVLKPGGFLILFLPDQQTYVAECRANGSQPNMAHKHPDFSLHYVKMCLAGLGIGQDALIHEMWPFPGNPYSFSLVVRKPGGT